MSDNDAWHYMVGKEVVGPISLAQLRELALTNVVNQKTLVYTSGMAEWRAACDTGISRFSRHYRNLNIGRMLVSIEEYVF